MTINDYEELIRLKKVMNQMIEGTIGMDRTLIDRYNELCRMRMTSESH